MMNSLTRIALICLCLDVVRAQGAASGPSPAAATASNEEVNKLALWPDVDIRGLLAGEPVSYTHLRPRDLSTSRMPSSA